MNGQEIECVKKRDFGVLFTEDLKAAAQCRLAYKKANRALRMIS